MIQYALGFVFKESRFKITWKQISGPDDSVFNIRFYRFSVAQNYDWVKTAILTAIILKNILNVIMMIVKGTNDALLVCM